MHASNLHHLFGLHWVKLVLWVGLLILSRDTFVIQDNNIWAGDRARVHVRSSSTFANCRVMCCFLDEGDEADEDEDDDEDDEDEAKRLSEQRVVWSYDATGDNLDCSLASTLVLLGRQFHPCRKKVLRGCLPCRHDEPK